MKRCFVYAALLLTTAGSTSLAQTPRPPADSEFTPRANAAPTGIGAAEENQPVRRRLAEPLRNQFDPFRPQPNDDLQADVVTPEMWLYMQEMRRYDDPLLAVRRNAATRAAHRRARIAALQWFGFSNTRPQASPIPIMDVYSPMWTSNSWNPYTWTGGGNAWTAVHIDPIVITR